MTGKPKQFGQCKLCGERRKLCGSHIVPEFCYKSIYDNKHRATAIHAHGRRTMRRGYKEPLLCEVCEGRLNTNYEQPFHKFWYGNVITAAKVTARYLIVRDFQYDWMKLFHLSILWRFHVSEGFGSIALGPYGDIIKGMLLAGRAGAENHLPIAGRLLLDDKKIVMDRLVSQPTVGKIEHSHCYVIQYAGCEWYFLMASTLNRKQTQLFRPSSIRIDGTMKLTTKRYQRSYGFKEMGRTQRAWKGR